MLDSTSGRLVGITGPTRSSLFHHISAFEREDELLLDVCPYDDASVIDALYLHGAFLSG